MGYNSAFIWLNVLQCDRTETKCSEVIFSFIFPQASFFYFFPAFTFVLFVFWFLITVFFCIIPYDSYFNVVILNSFLVSLCFPFVLHHQTITGISLDFIKKFCVTAAGGIPF